MLLTLTTGIAANDMEQRYKEVRQVFEARHKYAQDELKQYLQDYPYTTYESEVQLMLGVLQTERGRYKQALRTFNKVQRKDLARDDQPLFYFYRGYAFLKQGDMDQALICFKTIKDSRSPFTMQGKYYYAYTLYTKGDYKSALPYFLEIEDTEQYKNIVPYYIVQIYYAQKNYDEAYTRAETLLKNNRESEYNSELHRILGEMYFAKGEYEQTVTHLRQYDTHCTKHKAVPLREDTYLLGIAEYKQEQYADAIKTLKRVKQKNDSISESTCLHLAHSYLKTGDTEKAKLAYAATAKFNLDPEVREEAMYNYALCTYENSTALGESITAFNDFLREYPNTQHANDAYRLLATVYMSSKNYRAALDAVNAMPVQTAKVQEIRQYLRYQIGVDCFLQGRMKESAQWMTDVIDNDTNNSVYKTDAYYYRAEAKYRLRQYEACYNDINLFLKQTNNTSYTLPQARYLQGYSLFSLKQYSEAEVAFRYFLAENKAADQLKADALNRIGDCCFNNRAFQDAVKAYRQVIEMKAAGADYATFQTGYALGLMRKYGEKAQMMEQLVSQYPKSDYADDALYEIARASQQDNNTEQAIDAYQRLIKNYPNSNLARKSALELAMAYRNSAQTDKALDAFKTTINTYPGTEEAYLALEALEQIYVENNRLAEYLDYAKQLSRMNMKVSNQEDSLTYVTAELQYMLGNYTEAAAGLATYTSQFCPGGRYCVSASWYAADCHYRLGNNNEAIALYQSLLDTPGNPYMEETATRLGELQYDKKDYAAARESFRRMRAIATDKQKRNTADLGILRCSYFLQDDSATVDVANRLIDSDDVSDNVKEEAMYNRGKVFYRMQEYGRAAVDFSPLSKNVRVVTGAEAAYLLADCYFRLGALDSSESEIMRFAGQRTQHQYWLAKALILLADINVQRGDLFQAKQYLLSLQANYKDSTDDIMPTISDKLAEIESLEQPKTADTEQEDNTNELEDEEL